MVNGEEITSGQIVYERSLRETKIVIRSFLETARNNIESVLGETRFLRKR